MPVEPSIAISGEAEIGQCGNYIDPLIGVYFKRSLDSIAESGIARIDCLEVRYKRALSRTLEMGHAQTQFDLQVKRAISGEVDIGRANPALLPVMRHSLDGALDIGRSDPRMYPVQVHSLDGEGELGKARTGMDAKIKHALDATTDLGFADARLLKIYRKILLPAPKAELYLMTPLGDVTLHGSKQVLGNSYRYNLIARGYHLNVIQSGTGPYLRFFTKRRVGEPDSQIVFEKQSKYPISGIGIDSVQVVATTEHGDLEEMKAQIRIHPEDWRVMHGKASTLFYKLELIDPLSERSLVAEGSFSVGI